ncbi:hypothetical protein J7K76_03955 [Candidatus Bipolaricaulota bacterium]|nr:hypothetical protein [Candidatus Bipolaricaulota bacterium]
MGVGESLQTAIGAAQTGSVIVLQGRERRENITVTKDLVIVGGGRGHLEPGAGQGGDRGERRSPVTLIGLVLEGAHTSGEQCQGFYSPARPG